jgi:hypothetical protein
MTRSPNAAFLVTKPQPTSPAVGTRVSAYAPDGASRATYSRGATPPSNDAPTRRSTQQPQLRQSMSFPTRTTELRSSGEFQAIRDFLMVSSRHCSELSKVSTRVDGRTIRYRRTKASVGQIYCNWNVNGAKA